MPQTGDLTVFAYLQYADVSGWAVGESALFFVRADYPGGGGASKRISRHALQANPAGIIMTGSGTAFFPDLPKGTEVSVRANQSNGSAVNLSGTDANFVTFKVDPDFTFLAAFNTPKLTQTKFLTADKTSDGTMSDLTFSNLTIGQWYNVDLVGAFKLSHTSAVVDNISIIPNHDGVNLKKLQAGLMISGSATIVDVKGISFSFQATASTIIFSAGSIGPEGTIDGNGTLLETHVVLTEIPPRQETNIH